MADYTDSKLGYGSVVHENEIDNDWTDLEPLIAPEKVKRLHLFGLPLVSAIRNPITNEVQVMDDPLIKEYINEAVALAELETKVCFIPRQIREKHAFDRATYDAFGYFQLRQRPVNSIESLLVVPSNNEPVYSVPLEWVDTGLLHQGQINIVPLTIAVKTGAVVPLSSTPGGAQFLSIFGNKPWISAFWDITYTVGFPEGKFSRIVNHLIGVVAAMEILSALAATYSRTQSQSLSFDGLSQSVSSPGPQLFNERLDALGQKRKWLVGRLMSAYNVKLVLDNV